MTAPRSIWLLPVLCALLACRIDPAKPGEALHETPKSIPQKKALTLPEVRKALKTSVFLETDKSVPAEPPAGMFELVKYPAPLGENLAYVTPKQPGEKHPAIVWIAGGTEWSIGASAWEDAPPENDQSARAFREAGIILMLPSLRGSHSNPGRNECMLGEIDDVIAAADWLAKRDDVDPNRIYLGGHSTGGTIALLTVESTTRFRTVFAFGAVADVRHYGPSVCLTDDAPKAEWQARAAWLYLSEVETPTWIIEGSDGGNAKSIAFLMKHVGDAPVQAIIVPDMSHFSVLSPGTKSVAKAILADTGAKPSFAFSAQDVAAGR